MPRAPTNFSPEYFQSSNALMPIDRIPKGFPPAVSDQDIPKPENQGPRPSKIDVPPTPDFQGDLEKLNALVAGNAVSASPAAEAPPEIEDKSADAEEDPVVIAERLIAEFIASVPDGKFKDGDDEYEITGILKAQHQQEKVSLLIVKDTKTGQEFVGKFAVPSPQTLAALQGLRREAKVLKNLNHPSIIPLHKVLFHKNGGQDVPILLTPYLKDHTPLGKVMIEEFLTVDVVVDIVIQILDALKAANEKGMWHRDIKPSNILAKKDPERPGYYKAVLIDFGSSKIAGHLTRDVSYGIGGTPNYWSPEQPNAKLHTPAMDIFSLVLVIIDMFSRREREHCWLSPLSEQPSEEIDRLERSNAYPKELIEALRTMASIRDRETRWKGVEILRAWKSKSTPVTVPENIPVIAVLLPEAVPTPVVPSVALAEIPSMSSPSANSSFIAQMIHLANEIRTHLSNDSPVGMVTDLEQIYRALNLPDHAEAIKEQGASEFFREEHRDGEWARLSWMIQQRNWSSAIHFIERHQLKPAEKANALKQLSLAYDGYEPEFTLRRLAREIRRLREIDKDQKDRPELDVHFLIAGFIYQRLGLFDLARDALKEARRLNQIGNRSKAYLETVDAIENGQWAWDPKALGDLNEVTDSQLLKAYIIDPKEFTAIRDPFMAGRTAAAFAETDRYLEGSLCDLQALFYLGTLADAYAEKFLKGPEAAPLKEKVPSLLRQWEAMPLILDASWVSKTNPLTTRQFQELSLIFFERLTDDFSSKLAAEGPAMTAVVIESQPNPRYRVSPEIRSSMTDLQLQSQHGLPAVFSIQKGLEKAKDLLGPGPDGLNDIGADVLPPWHHRLSRFGYKTPAYKAHVACRGKLKEMADSVLAIDGHMAAVFKVLTAQGLEAAMELTRQQMAKIKDARPGSYEISALKILHDVLALFDSKNNSPSSRTDSFPSVKVVAVTATVSVKEDEVAVVSSGKTTLQKQESPKRILPQEKEYADLADLNFRGETIPDVLRRLDEQDQKFIEGAQKSFKTIWDNLTDNWLWTGCKFGVMLPLFLSSHSLFTIGLYPLELFNAAKIAYHSARWGVSQLKRAFVYSIPTFRNIVFAVADKWDALRGKSIDGQMKSPVALPDASSDRAEAHASVSDQAASSLDLSAMIQDRLLECAAVLPSYARDFKISSAFTFFLHIYGYKPERWWEIINKISFDISGSPRRSPVQSVDLNRYQAEVEQLIEEGKWPEALHVIDTVPTQLDRLFLLDLATQRAAAKDILFKEGGLKDLAVKMAFNGLLNMKSEKASPLLRYMNRIGYTYALQRLGSLDKPALDEQMSLMAQERGREEGSRLVRFVDDEGREGVQPFLRTREEYSGFKKFLNLVWGEKVEKDFMGATLISFILTLPLMAIYLAGKAVKTAWSISADSVALGLAAFVKTLEFIPSGNLRSNFSAIDREVKKGKLPWKRLLWLSATADELTDTVEAFYKAASLRSGFKSFFPKETDMDRAIRMLQQGHYGKPAGSTLHSFGKPGELPGLQLALLTEEWLKEEEDKKRPPQSWIKRLFRPIARLLGKKETQKEIPQISDGSERVLPSVTASENSYSTDADFTPARSTGIKTSSGNNGGPSASLHGFSSDKTRMNQTSFGGLRSSVFAAAPQFQMKPVPRSTAVQSFLTRHHRLDLLQRLKRLSPARRSAMTAALLRASKMKDMRTVERLLGDFNYRSMSSPLQGYAMTSSSRSSAMFRSVLTR